MPPEPPEEGPPEDERARTARTRPGPARFVAQPSAGALTVQGYRAASAGRVGAFKVGGAVRPGAILLTPDSVQPWTASDPALLTLADLAPLLDLEQPIELLLVGTGPKMAPLPAALTRGLAERRLSVEAMDSGAAARTFNILVAEGRRIGAALLPP